MQYPSSLQFTKVKDGIRVRRIKNSKYSPDIWAMSYLLNEDVAQGCTVKTAHLDVKEPTEILRLYFLPKIFSGFSCGNFGSITACLWLASSQTPLPCIQSCGKFYF